MNKYYNRLRRFCAFIIGAVFFIGGILKLMDPVGAGLVVDEYYRLAGLGFMDFSSKFVGVLMALFEILLGAALMTGLWRRVVAAVTVAVLLFFTLLTLVLLIFNPEMDCGCFGEAVHLTHFQTFMKNVILCVLAIVAFSPINRLGRPKQRKYVSFAIVGASSLLFGIYSLIYLPIMDFTAFKPGARLAAAVSYEPDVYKAIFVYEKGGEEKSFNLENLPDSSWTYVRTDSYEAELTEDVPVLSFSDMDGEYMDEMAAEGRVMTISVYDADALSDSRAEKVSAFMEVAGNAGFRTLLLLSGTAESATASLPDALVPYADRMYFSDYKTLITLNRSNAGASFIHDGLIVKKWARTGYPSSEELDALLLEEPMEFCHSCGSRSQLSFQAFLLYIFAVLFFI